MRRILLIWGSLALLYGLIYLAVEAVDTLSMRQLATVRVEAAAAQAQLRGPAAEPAIAEQLGVRFQTDAEGIARPVNGHFVSAEVPHGRAVIFGYIGRRYEAGGWSLLLILMVLLGSELSARQIAAPLRKLAEGAERLAEGLPGPPLDERGGDEFAQLARTFNRMSALVAQRDAELKSEHETAARAALLKTRLLEQSYAEMREILREMHPEDAAMERNLKTMQALVEDLAQAASLEQGTLQVRLSPTDLATQVELVREMLAPQLQARGLTLETSLAELPPVQADPDRLRQILVNVFSNAIKFTPEGTLSLRARRQDGQVILELHDRGPGIAPEALTRVFEEFRQAHEGIHQQYGGAGLGLSISRRLAELQGGKLELESVPGQGTCARIILRVSS